MYTDDIIYGKMIRLQMCTDDFVTESYVAWLNDKDVNKYLESRYVEQTITLVKDYVEKNISSQDQILFAIVARDTDKHIGNIHLTVNRIHKRCSIAYFIGEKSCWGKGMATEAIRLATGWAFENFNIDRMDAGIYACNTGSRKALQKAGYKQEGVRAQFLLLDNGERVDGIETGLLRDDFKKMDYCAGV